MTNNIFAEKFSHIFNIDCVTSDVDKSGTGGHGQDNAYECPRIFWQIFGITRVTSEVDKSGTGGHGQDQRESTVVKQ